MRIGITLTLLAGIGSLARAQSPESIRIEVPIGASRLAATGIEIGRVALSEALEAARIGLTHARFSLESLRTDYDGQLSIAGPPAPDWDAQDPADSLYREARNALNRRNYSKAAYLFSQIHGDHPRSSYAADAYYWEAVARYRSGSSDNLRTARDLILRQRDTFPRARTREDATDLLAEINARLARGGDAEAAERVSEVARRAASAQERPSRSTARTGRRARCDDEDDEKMAALNALLQMDEDRALPLLEKVMARRDEGSTCLRRKAVFLISQHSGSESEGMLLDAVRSDPDGEVREQAVFWLGQAGGERAAVALDSILRDSDDPQVQEKAIFALSQNSSPRSLQSLRDYAMKSSAPTNLRENAIFWLGQSGNDDNVDFLKTIFRSVREQSLKEKIIFSVAQGSGRASQRWLTEVAGNRGESIEIRKNAIFWLGQSAGASLPELFSLYDRMTDREIREQLIFVYSQRQERAAVDKLVEIAKTDPDRELRKKALFWLGQSRDPRVAEVLEDILSKP